MLSIHIITNNILFFLFDAQVVYFGALNAQRNPI